MQSFSYHIYIILFFFFDSGNAFKWCMENNEEGKGLELNTALKAIVDDWVKYVDECFGKSKSKDLLPACMNLYLDIKRDKEENADKKECKCASFCFAKKVGTMNQDGLFNNTKIKEVSAIIDSKLPNFSQEFNKVWEVCKKVEGKDCELAFNAIKCVLEKSDKTRAFRDLFFGILKK